MKFLKNILVLVLTIIIIVSCTSNTIYKKPKDLIPKDQMVDLLVDMYIANAATNVYNKDLKKKINYMPLVYEKYGIDSLRFNTSNEFYMSRIDDYEILHKEVKSRLQKILDTTEAVQKIKDSILRHKKFKKKKKNKDLIKELEIKKEEKSVQK